MIPSKEPSLWQVPQSQTTLPETAADRVISLYAQKYAFSFLNLLKDSWQVLRLTPIFFITLAMLCFSFAFLAFLGSITANFPVLVEMLSALVGQIVFFGLCVILGDLLRRYLQQEEVDSSKWFACLYAWHSLLFCALLSWACGAFALLGFLFTVWMKLFMNMGSVAWAVQLLTPDFWRHFFAPYLIGALPFVLMILVMLFGSLLWWFLLWVLTVYHYWHVSFLVAFKSSIQFARYNFFSWLILLLSLTGFNAIGAVFLGAGLIWTLPLSMGVLVLLQQQIQSVGLDKV